MINLESKNKIGIVEIKENKYRVEFNPNLKDLPLLYVNMEGVANQPVLSSKLIL